MSQHQANPYPFYSHCIKANNKLSTINYLKAKTDLEEVGVKAIKNNNLKQKLSKLKKGAIKEMLYTNLDIPNQWVRKLDYKDYIVTCLQDKKLENYMKLSYPSDEVIKENMNLRVSDNSYLKNYKNNNFLDVNTKDIRYSLNRDYNKEYLDNQIQMIIQRNAMSNNYKDSEFNNTDSTALNANAKTQYSLNNYNNINYYNNTGYNSDLPYKNKTFFDNIIRYGDKEKHKQKYISYHQNHQNLANRNSLSISKLNCINNANNYYNTNSLSNNNSNNNHILNQNTNYSNTNISNRNDNIMSNYNTGNINNLNNKNPHNKNKSRFNNANTDDNKEHDKDYIEEIKKVYKNLQIRKNTSNNSNNNLENTSSFDLQEYLHTNMTSATNDTNIKMNVKRSNRMLKSIPELMENNNISSNNVNDNTRKFVNSKSKKQVLDFESFENINKFSNQYDLVKKNDHKSRKELDKEAKMYFSKEKEREKKVKRKQIDEIQLHLDLMELGQKDKKANGEEKTESYHKFVNNIMTDSFFNNSKNNNTNSAYANDTGDRNCK